MRNETSPARVYALVFGAVLVVAGIIGFFYSSDFGSPGKVDGVLGILDVNGWHNVVHIATGVLVSPRSPEAPTRRGHTRSGSARSTSSSPSGASSSVTETRSSGSSP
jgi:hypothetical protein